MLVRPFFQSCSLGKRPTNGRPYGGDGSELFLPQRGRMSAQLTGEGEE